MKLTRVASAIGIVLLVLAAGAVFTVAIFGERLLAGAIERAGPTLIGRKVNVDGVTIDWGRLTTVAATGLVVADADWSASPALFRARRAELTIDLLDLLRLRLSPMRLGLREPVLHLSRNTQGRWNLPQSGSGGASGGRSPAKLAAPREIEVESGELTVDDLASPGIEARVAALSARTPRAAGGIEFNGTASRGGSTPIAFSGRSGSIAKLLRSGDGDTKPFPIQLALGPEAARLSATGHIARPLDLAGFDLRLQGQGDDLAPLLTALAAAPATATPPYQLTARMTDTERGWELEDVAARLGESRMRGKVALSSGQQRPRLSMDLVAPRIVLSDFDWLASLGGRREAPSGSLADAPLPTAWLRRADADGDLRVERLEGLATGPAKLRLGFELEQGRLRIQPIRLELAQGSAEGTATIDVASGAALRVALRVDGSGVQLGPLLAPLGIDQVTGRLRSASVDLRGQGTTTRELAAGLDGAAHLRIVDGSIALPDLSHVSMGLVETLGYVLGGGGSGDAAATPVACAIGDFPVRQGVVHAERLTILTPRVVIAGEGTVRLNEATVRLTLVPRPLDEAFLRVVVPVVISGKLASPEVTTHPELRAGLRPDTMTDICRDELGRR